MPVNQQLKEAQSLRRRRDGLKAQIEKSKSKEVRDRLGRELTSIERSLKEYDNQTKGT
jgi:hypothetical protein